jgi:hypothetical protein
MTFNRPMKGVKQMADVKKGEIPEGYSNAVINEQTGKVELKEPMEGANESWPDVNRRSTKK